MSKFDRTDRGITVIKAKVRFQPRIARSYVLLLPPRYDIRAFLRVRLVGGHRKFVPLVHD